MSGEVGWIDVCRVPELPPGAGRRVDVTPPIAVFNVAGAFWAIDDTCTHGDFSLAEGYLDDSGAVECIGHMARFCVRDGRALSLPATVSVRTHATRVVDDVVQILPAGRP